MNTHMSILKSHCWQRFILSVKGLIRDEPLAVGVDWGSRMIKSAVIQTDRNGLALHDFSLQPVVNQSLQKEHSEIELVQTLQQKMAVPLHAIGTSLSGPSVLVKTITLPMMTKEDIRDHLALELDRYIALDAQDVFWDVYIPESSSDDLNDQQECFLVVAKKENVEKQVEVFSQCEIGVQFVDLDVFALINLVTYNYGREGSWLLAHIGPTGMMMVAIVEGEPAYIRKVAYEVEWYRDFLDLMLLPRISRDSKMESGASETLLLEKFLEEMRIQICETLESFSDHGSIRIDKGILLSGGYATAPGIENLGHSLGVPVHLLDPFMSVKVPHAIQQDPVFQQAAPLMGVAMGVALRGALTHDQN